MTSNLAWMWSFRRLEPILAQRGRLLGMVLTHGHEDHIGAVPRLVSFIKGLKVYGSPMTLALVEHKLRDAASSTGPNSLP